MHDSRIVDLRRVCPHSMQILLNKAARAWQWRRVALHEGYDGLIRGAVVTPLFAGLSSSWLSAHEQAHLRSVVVDGQWTQQRKYRVAKTLSPLCALCGSEECSLIHRQFRCSEVQHGRTTCWAPFTRQLSRARFGRTSCSGYTVPHESLWTGDRSLFTGVIYGDGSAYRAMMPTCA